MFNVDNHFADPKGTNYFRDVIFNIRIKGALTVKFTFIDLTQILILYL